MLAGKNSANPIAMLNASVDMLEHLGHRYHARIINESICKTLCDDQVQTVDLGGTATSTEVVDRIKCHIRNLAKDGTYRSSEAVRRQIEIKTKDEAIEF